jgi:predicted metal-dependent enzyme (double-stranded beta helix superfamily)
MTISSLPARYLDKAELAELVEELAGRPELWDDQVAYSEDHRHYASLHRDEYVDIWLLCWAPGNDTGWHDHDVSSGAVRVVRGTLKESNPRMGGPAVEVLVSAGSAIRFGPDHIHRLTGEADQSVSIHAYSPPLSRLGQYTIDDSGVMRRTSVSYADELRPVAPEPSSQAA